VDVYEWARTGTGVTPSGWTVTNIDEYTSEKGVRFDTQYDQALSPEFPGVVTQLIMNVKASSTNTTRFLTVVPVVAGVDARSFPAKASKSYEDQALVWRYEEDVRRFSLQNSTGTGNSGWGIRSLDVYIDRVEAPQDRREEKIYSDAFSAAWTPDARAVSNEIEVCRITTVPPKYDLLKCWDFTLLTNTSWSTTNFVKSTDFPPSLSDVEGLELNLQGKAGGHLQIGKRDTGGSMVLPLPEGWNRTALMTLFRHTTDSDSIIEVCSVAEGGVTNGFASPFLTEWPAVCSFSFPDDAVSLVLLSRPKHRIRVENVKIVTGYLPGYATTNGVTRCRTVRNVRTFKGLDPGDFIWRVKSFDGQGVDSAWSSYRMVTLSTVDPKRPVPGLAVIIR